MSDEYDQRSDAEPPYPYTVYEPYAERSEVRSTPSPGEAPPETSELSDRAVARLRARLVRKYH